MSDIVSPLLEWLYAHPELAGLATFIISAAESVAIVGTIVPGSIMMTALGTLAGAGVIPLYETIFWAIMGAIVGDGISYWIGHYFKERLPLLWPFKLYPNLLKSGERFFYRYGSMSVFIGRFVGPVRALVPLVAGMFGMRPLHFTLANLTSAILWAPIYMMPGILLGRASLELPRDIAVHVILVLLLMGMFILLILWFVYKISQLIQIQVHQLQHKVWLKLKRSRYFSSATILLKHHDESREYGQFNLAILFISTVVAFIALACLVKLNGPAHLVINDAVYHLFRGLSVRTPALDNLFINFTLFGQKQILFPVIVVLFFWLFTIKHKRMALHVLALSILTVGSIFVLKHLFNIPRPWGIIYNPETFSMPSGHTTLATVFYIGLALLVTRPIKKSYRWPFFTIATLLVFAVSFSRLYLGAHWFTDVLGSWLLGASLLIFISISYQRKAERPINPWSLLLISVLTMSLVYGIFHYYYFATLQKQYVQVKIPIIAVTRQDWAKMKPILPTYRVSLFGFPSQILNLQWSGDIATIRDTLLQEGWEKPPARDFASTLHRLADISSTEYLPLISPQYLDQKPILILTRFTNDKKNLLVLRLWQSNRVLADTKDPIWVGMISLVPRPYSWIYKSNSDEINISQQLIFPKMTSSQAWYIKTVPLSKEFLRNSHQSNMILITNQKFIDKP